MGWFLDGLCNRILNKKAEILSLSNDNLPIHIITWYIFVQSFTELKMYFKRNREADTTLGTLKKRSKPWCTDWNQVYLAAYLLGDSLPHIHDCVYFYIPLLPPFAGGGTPDLMELIENNNASYNYFVGQIIKYWWIPFPICCGLFIDTYISTSIFPEGHSTRELGQIT